MVELLALLLAASTGADTTNYVVLSHGRRTGDMRVINDGDSIVVRFQYQDRQRGPRIETRYRIANGRVVAMETRGFAPDGVLGPVTERVDLHADSARWISGLDTTRVRSDAVAFYRLRSVSPYDDALLARHLLGRPTRSGKLLPDGTARAEVVADTTVTVSGAVRRIKLVFIDGVGLSPNAVWLDDRGGFFTSGASWFIAVPQGADAVVPALREIEKRHRAARSEALAKRLTPAAARSI